MGKIIMVVYDWIRAHDPIPDREYYTWKMRRNLEKNALWWVLGFAVGVMILLLVLSPWQWAIAGSLLTAVGVWLLLHLGGFC